MLFEDLPPLGALRAFEAVARRRSFKAAASELFVTPTAISHQIRQLEEKLGLRVLDRSPRAVTLTAGGAELYEATARSFADLARVYARLRRGRTEPVLTLSATTGFLSQWLVPRLAEVQRVLSDVELRLHASDDPVTLERDGVSLAIRYGKGPFAHLHTTKLCDDAFAPVCSPGLKLTSNAELRRARLLHVDGLRRPRPLPTWARWCAHAGVAGVKTDAGLRFTNSLHAVQAALAGQGVALISLVLVRDALAEGLLVQPFTKVLRGDAYHFVSLPEVAGQPEVARLREWLQSALGHRET